MAACTGDDEVASPAAERGTRSLEWVEGYCCRGFRRQGEVARYRNGYHHDARVGVLLETGLSTLTSKRPDSFRSFTGYASIMSPEHSVIQLKSHGGDIEAELSTAQLRYFSSWWWLLFA